MFRKDGCTWASRDEYYIVNRVDKQRLHRKFKKHHRKRYKYRNKHGAVMWHQHTQVVHCFKED